MTTKLPWFRCYAEMIDDPKLQLLAFEDRWHFVAILCLKRDGTLDADYSSDELRERIIAKKLGLSQAASEEAKRRLYEVDLVDQAWQPMAWDKRQYESDSSAERVRRHRERKRNGGVTLPKRSTNALDTDTDTDADAESEGLRSSSVVALATSSSSTAHRSANKADENKRRLAAAVAGATKRVRT